MARFIINTTGTKDPVIFKDLGYRTFYTANTVNFDLANEYTIDEITRSKDVQNAINNGYITAKNEFDDILFESIYNIGTANSYVILCGGVLTNGVNNQLVSGNVGHIGTETNPFTFSTGIDISDSSVLGTISTPNTPIYDAYALYTHLNLLVPTFSYVSGAIDLATNVTSPDGTGVFKAGIYKITGVCNIGTAGITLTGVGNFIFIISGAFDTTTSSKITLSNGALAENVFFVTSGIVTLATNITFNGTVLAGINAITTGAGFNLTGRLISQTDITLGGGSNTLVTPVMSTKVDNLARKITVSTAMPQSPNIGDLWVDTN